MLININIKQLSKRGRRVKPVPFVYDEPFDTVEDFIKATVKIMYYAFMNKEAGTIESEDGVFPVSNSGKGTHNSDDDHHNSHRKVLSQEELDNMAKIGKIAFDLVYGSKDVTLDKAYETALLAYKDGLVRLFVGDKEAGELEAPLTLKDGDEVTFIRLTFLAGRIW
jgi:hypothetical protein